MSIIERKEREKEKRRLSILRAAETLFAQNGLHQTNLEDVATAAEISKGTIYLYFKSKQDLFFSVIENKYQDYIVGLEKELDKATSLEEAIRFLVKYQLMHSQNHHHFFRIMMSEQSKERDAAHSELQRGFVHKSKLVLDICTTIFDRFMKNESRSFSSSTLALGITGTINAHVMSWLISGKSSDLDQAEKEINYLIINGIRN